MSLYFPIFLNIFPICFQVCLPRLYLYSRTPQILKISFIPEIFKDLLCVRSSVYRITTEPLYCLLRSLANRAPMLQTSSNSNRVPIGLEILSELSCFLFLYCFWKPYGASIFPKWPINVPNHVAIRSNDFWNFDLPTKYGPEDLRLITKHASKTHQNMKRSVGILLLYMGIWDSEFVERLCT